MIRRRMVKNQYNQEDDEMKEWTTIIDTVTTEEMQNPSYEIIPDGSRIEDYDFREIAAYVVYNANESQATSGYVRLQVTDVAGNTAYVQTMRGIPKSGYYRCLLHMNLGSVINLYSAYDSVNTSLAPTSMYDSPVDILSRLKRISIISYANIGANSTIKIMAR